MPASAPEAVVVRDLRAGERAAALALLARGMRDNPLNVAAYGPDPERRRRSLERVFATLFRTSAGTSASMSASDIGW